MSMRRSTWKRITQTDIVLAVVATVMAVVALAAAVLAVVVLTRPV